MRELRKLTRLEELARRIVGAVDETFEAVKNDRHAGVPLVHKVETLQLPMRLVTDAEYAEVKAAIAQEKPTQMRNRWHARVVERYESQKKDPHPAKKRRFMCCDLATWLFAPILSSCLATMGFR